MTPAGQTASPEHEEVEEEAVDEEAEAIREANIKAMISNNVKAERTAVMPKFLMVSSRSRTLCALHCGNYHRMCHFRHCSGGNSLYASQVSTVQIREGEKQLKKPFSSPSEGQPAESADLKRQLASRRKFVPWGGGKFNLLSFQGTLAEEAEEKEAGKDADQAQEQPKPAAPAAVDENPLILWQPGEPTKRVYP